MKTEWIRQRDIVSNYHMSYTQISRIRKEIEACPRYKGCWIYLNKAGWPLINKQIWEDYLHYRHLIRHGLEKHLPAFERG